MLLKMRAAAKRFEGSECELKNLIFLRTICILTGSRAIPLFDDCFIDHSTNSLTHKQEKSRSEESVVCVTPS